MSFITTNMSLVIPSVLSDTGPTYATLIDAAFVALDAHTHNSGSGIQITPAGMNITSDLTFQQNNATNLRTARLFNNTSITLGVNDKTCLYALNSELYYEDGVGNTVQVTSAGSLNIGTVSSLTIKDSLFTLEYFGDTSRKLQFSAANVPSSTTRIFTLPTVSANDTLASLTATQTLTATTLTGGTVSGCTAVTLISGSGTLTLPTSGTITIPGATDTVALLAASQTLTNKVLTGNTIASFTPNGGTNTITVPAITDTLVGLASAQTLTNKTLTAPIQSSYEVFTEISTPSSPSAGTVAIYAKTDNNMYYLNSSGLEQQIGSGSSSGGGINYISNGSFENGTVTGWVTYSNTAQSTPVNGTGGSPNVTFASTSSSPLRGTYSGLFTKGSVNYQGQGVAYAFTLSSIDVSKTLQLTFDASASSALVTGDIGIYVYDITNSVLITPSSVNLPTGNSSQYSLAFQTTTSTSYRLIFHVATVNANAYTFDLDQMSLSPVVRPMVAGESDWIAYTPTFSAGFGTVTNAAAQWRRIGDSIQVSGSCTYGTAAGSLASITLPSAVTSINSAKLSLSNTTSNPGNILGSYGTSGVADDGYVVSATGTSTSLIYFGGLGLGTSSLTPANGSTIGATGDVFVFDFKVPVTAWSSNITLASTTPMIEYVYNTSGTTSAGGSDTTSFGYGAVGAAIGSIASTTVTGQSVTTMRTRFQNAIQPTDRIQLEIQNATSGVWIHSGSSPIDGLTQSTGQYGVAITIQNNTDINVAFGNGGAYPTSTYAAAGTAWSSLTSYRWRVAKYSSIGGAELAPATSVSTGTITRENVWTAYTPVATGFGTVTLNTFFYKVLGDSLMVRGSFSTGTVAASTASISIPTGFTINSAHLSLANTTSNPGDIIGIYSGVGSSTSGSVVTAPGTSTSAIYFGAGWTGTNRTSQNGSAIIGSSTSVAVNFEVPLV